MNTPLRPLDPINDTLLFSAGTILLLPGPAHSPVAKSVNSNRVKQRPHAGAVVAIVGLSLIGVDFLSSYADAPSPRETRPGAKSNPRPTLVVVPPELPEPGSLNTSVAFVCSPSEAARLAAADRKLTFLLHVSGDFDDNEFT